MISIALAFLIGVLALLQFRSLPDIQLVWLLVPAIIAILYSQYFWIKTAGACCCGFLWCLFVAHQVMAQSLPVELEGQDVVIKGYIADFPQRKNRATRFLFSVEEMHFNGKSYPSPGKIRLNWYYATATPRVGEQWQFLVRLKPPHGFMNPGGFDYEGWLFQQRIRATGYIRKQMPAKRLATPSHSFLWQRLRFRLYEKIRQFTSDSSTAGLVAALAIGERDDIQASQWEVLRRTGTAHLMAISGLHIGLLASLGYWLGNRLWRLRSTGLKRLPAQKFAAVVALLFAFTYAALAGFSIPTQRALIMVSVVMLALLRQRMIQPTQVLAQSLLLVLLLDPLSVLSAGFWLSFAAVAIILYGLSGRLERISTWRSLFRTQWVVVLGLLPLTIGLFQQASLISPLTNLLAIPVVSFLVVPLTLLASALMFFSETLATSVLYLSVTILETLWQLLELAAQLSLSQIQLAATPLAIFAAVIGALLLISPKGMPLRLLGLVFCLPLIFPVTLRPQKGEMWLSLLDVGQGLAVVVQTQGHTLVYDAGPKFSDSFDTGEAVVAPFLRRAGVSQIDTLMVTHGDNDHIGGVASLQKRFPISNILSSVPEKITAISERCQQGQRWHWDGVQFDVLHPSKGYQPHRRHGNNRSCVLRVEADNGSVLLSGDIEKEAEEYLLAQAQTLESDVLLVPHHGSRTSSSRAFIEAVKPKLALFPVGYRNRYRLPSQKVVQRYQLQSVQGYATADSGAILLRFPNQHQPEVIRYRQQASRFWNHQLP